MVLENLKFLQPLILPVPIIHQDLKTLCIMPNFFGYGREMAGNGREMTGNGREWLGMAGNGREWPGNDREWSGMVRK